MTELATIAAAVASVVCGGGAAGGAYKQRDQLIKCGRVIFRYLQKQLGLIDQNAIVQAHLEEQLAEAQEHLEKVQDKLARLREHKEEIETQLSTNQQEVELSWCFQAVQTFFTRQTANTQTALDNISVLIRQIENKEAAARAGLVQAQKNLSDHNGGRLLALSNPEDSNISSNTLTLRMESLNKLLLEIEATLAEVEKWKVRVHQRIEKVLTKLRFFENELRTANEGQMEFINAAIRDETRKVETRKASASKLQHQAEIVQGHYIRLRELIQNIIGLEEVDEEKSRELEELKAEALAAKTIAKHLSGQVIKETLMETLKDLSFRSFIKESLLAKRVIPKFEEEFADIADERVTGLIQVLKTIVNLRIQLDTDINTGRIEEIKAQLASLGPVKSIIHELLLFRYKNIIEKLLTEFESNSEYSAEIEQLRKIKQHVEEGRLDKKLFKIKNKIENAEKIKHDIAKIVEDIDRLLSDLKGDGHHATFYRTKLTEIKTNLERGNSVESHKLELDIIIEQLSKNLAKSSMGNLLEHTNSAAAAEDEDETKSQEEDRAVQGGALQRTTSFEEDGNDIYEEFSVVGVLRDIIFGVPPEDQQIVNFLNDITYDNPELVGSLLKEYESKRIEKLYNLNDFIDPLSDQHKKTLQEAHNFRMSGDFSFFNFADIDAGTPPNEQPILAAEAGNGEELSADDPQVMQSNYYVNDYGQITTSILGTILLLYSQSYLG